MDHRILTGQVCRVLARFLKDIMAKGVKHTAKTISKISESMIGNKNAETWTEEEAIVFYEKALILSKDAKYDYIGEVAKDLDSYIDVFDYLADKFPLLKSVKEHIKRNCETNCFSNSKKGNIREATAIVNLKSNHGWTDRQQVGVSGGVTLNFDSDDSKL